MSRTNDLGRDEIPRLVVKLAIPTMLAQLVNVLYSIVDRMYIGTGVGDLALAGVGICARLYTSGILRLHGRSGRRPHHGYEKWEAAMKKKPVRY